MRAVQDLKPENFILTDSTPNAVLKARDFRFSCFYKVRVRGT